MLYDFYWSGFLGAREVRPDFVTFNGETTSATAFPFPVVLFFPAAVGDTAT